MCRQYLIFISAIVTILVIGAVESTGISYRIGAIARQNQDKWTKLIEVLDLTTVKLLDRQETVKVFFISQDITLTDGKLYGIANATIRPQDEFYAILQNPLLVRGKLTFPRLEADYAYETSVASGRVRVVIHDVTDNLEMYVKPESKTESIDPHTEVESYGHVDVTFFGGSFDGLMSLFEDKVREILPKILNDATSSINQMIKERVNRDLPTLAQMVTARVHEEIHGKSKDTA